jgi:hypothetical protein
MNRRESVWLVTIFLTCIGAFFLVNFIKPLHVYSIVENRNLQQRPVLTKEAAWSGAYSRVFETYYTDQFVKRDSWIQKYTQLELALGRPLVNNFYVNKQGWIVPHPTLSNTIPAAAMNQSVWTVKSFQDRLKQKGISLFYVATPHKGLMMGHLYPFNIENRGIQEQSELFQGKLAYQGVRVINVGKAFNQAFTGKELERLYFKTDHHWNALGAFEGFKVIMQQMGYAVPRDDAFSVSWVTGKDFLGAWNRQLYGLVSKKENIPIVTPKNEANFTYAKLEYGKWRVRKKNDIFSSGLAKPTVNYSDVYTGDLQGWKVMNAKPAIDKKIVIFKDSYENPTSLLFASQFRQTTIYDLRGIHSTPADKLVAMADADIVLIMNNSANLYGDTFKFGLTIK